MKHSSCKDAHLPLLDAGIDAANEPHSNKDGNHPTENSERLTNGIHEGVVVGNLILSAAMLKIWMSREDR